MERLYNPDLMTEAEIKQTFVARQPTVDELVALLKSQPKGAGMQHVVIVAPRGMGKTTMLLMVQFALTDQKLNTKWQAVRFPEESYGVSDLADFWLETMRNLSNAVEEPELAEKAEELTEKYHSSQDLQEAALAVLVQWCRTHKKRLLLLVDNFDQILEQIGSERDNAALRNVLMNDGDIMLIGGATTIFREARAYDQPLYNFFRLVNLPELSFEDVLDLLRQRAAADGAINFEATLQANRSRLRVLRYFTGGNPRLVLMLYRVVVQSEVTQVRDSLEKLLDEVTPYYKAKIDALAPQQRKILDHIARISAQTNEGLTPGEVAGATRITPQSASKQLQRLGELGYVRAANVKGRHSYYTLSEPLYAIWHQMRFGRGAKRRMQWLVEFLKGWYDAEELGSESSRLESLFSDLIGKGLESEARKTLDYRRYLAHAMSDEEKKNQVLEKVVFDHLRIKSWDELKEVLEEIPLGNLGVEVLYELLKCHQIDQGQWQDALRASPRSEEDSRRLMLLMELGIQAMSDGRYEEAILHFSGLISTGFVDDIELRNTISYIIGFCKYENGDYIGALEEFSEYKYDFPKRGTEFKKNLLFIVGVSLFCIGNYGESIIKFDDYITIFDKNSESWKLRALALSKMERKKESTESFKRSVELNSKDFQSEFLKAFLEFELDNNSETFLQCMISLKNANDCADISATMKLKTNLLLFLFSATENKLKEAEVAWHQAVGIESNLHPEQELANQVLTGAALSGHGKFVLKLITDSHTEELFFPLHRALTYLSTRDELLIENLSPEVRNLVLDMVEKLRPQFESATLPSKRPKKKSAPRNRTRKQLS